MHENRTYYNVVEANAMIPRLEQLFSEMAHIQHQVNDLKRRADDLGLELDPVAAMDGPPSSHPEMKELELNLQELSEAYATRIACIEDLGVVIDDLDLGMVSFYSWVQGREVFLSWQFGESEVKHWHGVTEKSAVRRMLKRSDSRRSIGQAIH